MLFSTQIVRTHPVLNLLAIFPHLKNTGHIDPLAGIARKYVISYKKCASHSLLQVSLSDKNTILWVDNAQPSFSPREISKRDANLSLFH